MASHPIDHSQHAPAPATFDEESEQHDAEEPDAGVEDFDPEHVLALAQAAHREAAAETAHSPSDRAFGFTGFGAGFQPYSYEAGLHLDHAKLDPKVRALGAQHVRMFVPAAVVMTGMHGKAGAALDHRQQRVTELEQQIAAGSTPELEAHLAAAKRVQAHDYEISDSFEKTLELAGKHATINLTFLGGTNHPEQIPVYAAIVGNLVGRGYAHLQVTLENEPNGGDNGPGFRGEWNAAVKRNDRAGQDAALGKYVHAYELLDQDLHATQQGDVRNAVEVVGGDMRGSHRKLFFETITRLGLNKFVDAYSFHLYWGADGNFAGALATLKQIRALAHGQHGLAHGKALYVTEFGKERFRTKQERHFPKPGELGPDGKPKQPLPAVTSVEAGVVPAFQQCLFALSAINDGFSGAVKWDAFYDGPAGDGRGKPGGFSMIRGPNQDYHTDATYRLMRLFTHATEPGWKVTGTNHGVAGAQAHFRSDDGKGGAILAMSEAASSVSTAGLPHGEKLHVAVWNADGNGGVHVHTLAHGTEHVHVPANGAVAISTKPLSN